MKETICDSDFAVYEEHDIEARKEILQNIKWHYNLVYSDLAENDYFGNAVKTEQDRYNVTMQMLHVRIWTLFHDIEKHRPTVDELKSALPFDSATNEVKQDAENKKRVYKLWTKEECSILKNNWGTFSIQTIATRIGRPVSAVRYKARELKLGPVTRGTKSLNAVSRELGYNVETIKRAAIRAGINLNCKRAPSVRVKKGKEKSPRTFMLDEDDIEMLKDLLLNNDKFYFSVCEITDGNWGERNKPSSCKVCGTTERPHASRGLCINCYNRLRRHGEHTKYPLARTTVVEP